MPIDAAHQEEQIRLAEELFFSGEKLPSFAKSLFLGICDSRRILPFGRVEPDEQARVQDLVARLKTFCDAHLDPDWIDRKATIPNDVIRGLGDLGVLGCTIPAKYGGLGMSQFGYCRLVEELARRCGSTALFVNAHQSIGLKALLLYGTEQQRERFLRPLARGEMLAAFALTEPNAGSDAAGVETTALFDPERDIYHLNGRKQWITNGSLAGMLTVMAQTRIDGRNRITAFIVTPDMPGFEVTDRALEKVGMRGTTTSNLAFNDVQVPAENILGEPGHGLSIALNCLNYGRTTFGASCTGIGKELYEKAVAHGKTRHQFKRPLVSFGLVKEKIAQTAALVYAMDATTYLTASLLDRGEEDFMLETAILKVFASDSLWQILYDTMQIFGGRSFFCDAPFERMMRDARLNMIGEGSNEVLRAFIGAVGIRDTGMQLKEVATVAKKPLSGLGALLGFGKKTLSQVVRNPTLPVNSPSISREAVQFGARIRRLGIAVPRLLAKYREDIIEQQLALNRLAEAGIALYTTAAVLSRLDSELSADQDRTPSMQNDLAAGKWYCRLAFDRFDRAYECLFDNDDSTVESVADQITGWK